MITYNNILPVLIILVLFLIVNYFMIKSAVRERAKDLEDIVAERAENLENIVVEIYTYMKKTSHDFREYLANKQGVLNWKIDNIQDNERKAKYENKI